MAEVSALMLWEMVVVSRMPELVILHVMLLGTGVVFYPSTMAALVPMHVFLLGTRVVFYPSRIHVLTSILVILLGLLVELRSINGGSCLG